MALVWLNILYLLPLCLLPFGASLIARFDEDPVALRVYGVLLLAIAVSRLAVWLYVSRRPHLLFAQVDPRSRNAGITLVAGSGAAYLIAIALAGAVPTASLVIYGAVPVLYFATITLLRTSAPLGRRSRTSRERIAAWPRSRAGSQPRV